MTEKDETGSWEAAVAEANALWVGAESEEGRRRLVISMSATWSAGIVRLIAVGRVTSIWERRSERTGVEIVNGMDNEFE